jgi:hypothetical protein
MTVATESTATSSALVTFDFAHPNLWQTVRLGDWVYVAGGMPQIYDGSALNEIGFLHAPPAPGISTASGTGGSLPAASLYTYAVCYAQPDGNGNVHRSPLSVPVQISTDPAGASHSVTLAIFPLRTTLRQTLPGAPGQVGSRTVLIEVYRTTQATPTVLQLIAVIDNSIVATNTIMFTDTLADSDIAKNPIFNTALVASECPPSLSALAVHSDRVLGFDDTGRAQYFSTPLTAGEAPRFNDDFVNTWPEGPITASWSLEGRLHAATASRIFYLFGEGPSDSGAGSDFSSPTLWQSDIGVVDARAVAIFENGVVFNSRKGLYLETRSGELQWLGNFVQRTQGLYPVVTSISTLERDGVVRITCKASDSPSTAGVNIHWDYRKQRIATHDVASGYGFDGSCSADGTWYALQILSSFGGIASLSFEDATTCLDGGAAWVTMQLAGGWAKAQDLQGAPRVHRLQLLGQMVTPHGMMVETARNYSAAWDTDAGVWSDADIAAMTLEQMRHTPTVQKVQAISYRLTDAAPATLPAGTGAGPILRGLLFRTRGRRGEWKQLTSGQQR